MGHLVSIIIVTYNSELTIQRCLQAIFRQDYSAFEVVVYDNRSTDNTSQIIRDQFPQVKLIEGETNVGFALGNNLAAAQAKGDFFAFVNPDAFVDSRWLEPLVRALQARSDVGCVTPALYIAGKENVLNACGNRVHFSGITYCYQYGRPNSWVTPFEIEAISGAAFAMRRREFEQIGGFESSFFLYYEDTDLSMRIRRLGLKCLVVPESSVDHAFRSTFYPRKIFYLERNRYLSLFSLLELRILLMMLPALVVIELITWGYCLMKGWETVRAKADSWGDILQKRGWIRARRKALRAEPLMRIVVLHGFHERLELAYLDGSKLTRIAEAAAWLSAKPFLALLRILYR